MINITNLNFSYKDKPIFSDININFNSPGKYLILGENGSGKSTFLNLIIGTFFINHGDIFIDNLSVKIHYNIIRSLINYVPENLELDINYKLLSILKLYNLQIDNDLNLLNINTNYNYNQLSQGYKYRFMLYLAFKNFKKYILIDDLLKFQDESDSIINYINNNYQGRTIIVTSPKEINTFSWDKVFIIENGKLSNA